MNSSKPKNKKNRNFHSEPKRIACLFFGSLVFSLIWCFLGYGLFYGFPPSQDSLVLMIRLTAGLTTFSFFVVLLIELVVPTKNFVKDIFLFLALVGVTCSSAFVGWFFIAASMVGR